MSPVGVNGYQEDQITENNIEEAADKPNPCLADFPAAVRWSLGLVWKKKISPFDVGRISGGRFAK